MPRGRDTVCLHVYVSRDVDAELDEMAKLTGMTKSEFLRNLTEEALESERAYIKLGVRFRNIARWFAAKRAARKKVRTA